MEKISTYTGFMLVRQLKDWQSWLKLPVLLLLLPSMMRGQVYQSGKVCWPSENTIGYIYNKTAFTNTADFTTAGGLTMVKSGNAINVGGGEGTFNRYATFLTPHSFSNYSITMDVKMINAANQSSYGIGLGLKSINASSPNDVFGWVNLSTVSTPGQIFLYNNAGTLLSSSTSVLSFSQNDVVRQTFTLADTIITYSVQNVTTGTAAVTTSITCHNAFNGPLITRPNASNFAIYTIGGTFQMQALSVNITDKTNVNIAVASDSKFAYYAPSWAVTWPELLAAHYPSVAKACGSGDQAIHALKEVESLAMLNPRYLIWEYGSNDLRAGTPVSVVESVSDSIYKYFTARGTTVYFILMPEDSIGGGVGQKSLDLWYRSHYPSNYISAVWDGLLLNNVFNPALSSDGHVHLNAAGHAMIAQTLVASGKFNEQGICGGCESAPGLVYTANTQAGNQAFKGEIGTEFTVNGDSGIIIKQLGAFDDGGTGITGGIRVAVFDKTSHAIVSGLDVTISGLGDTIINGFRMKNITPVTLPQGNYLLVAKGYSSTERTANAAIGGGPYPAGNNGGGAISFGTKTFTGPDNASGFSYPATSAEYGATPQYLAGTFNFSKAIPCPSQNASLASLVLSQGVLEPVFSRNITSYTASITKSINSIIVTPAIVNAGAVIKVNGTVVADNTPVEINTPLDENIITIEVTAEDGTTIKTYTVNIIKAGCESSPAQAYVAGTKKGDQAHRGELGMEFTVNNPSGIVIKQLGAFDHDGDGINGLQPGGGVRVAIFNRATHIVVPGLDVIVAGLGDAYTGNHRMKNISPVTLPQGDYVIVAKGYGPNEKNGNISVSNGIYPPGDNSDGAITFKNEASYGPDDPSGFSYPNAAGDFGNNHQYQAGTFTFTKVIVCGGPSTDASLANLVLSDGTMAPAFATVTSNYSASVDKTITSITITPTSSDAGATIKVNGNPVVSGTASAPITLVKGANNIAVEVTAQDGTTKKTYSISVTIVGCESGAAQAYLGNIQTGSQAHRGELGMEFLVNNPDGIVIKQLGVFDDGGDGITGTQPGGVIRVAIFNRITKAIVPGLDISISGMADAYTGKHRMKNIPPVILPQGDYVLVTKGYGATEKNGNISLDGVPYPAGDDNGGAITFGNETSYGPDDPSGFNYPSTAGNFGTTHQYLAGTFSYTKVIPCSGPSNDASLFSLTLNHGTLAPAFATVTTSYSVTVDKNVTSIIVTPVATDTGATIKINGNTVPKGGSAEIVLNGGVTITVELTAQDGTTKKTYTINATVTGCESGIAQAYIASTQTGVQAHRGELGMQFIVNRTISVKQLGAFDDGGNGITGTQADGGIRVAVFNRATHTVVPGLDVSIIGLADAYTGKHRMKNITPVTLPPGDYVIVAKGYGPNEKNGNTQSVEGPASGDNNNGAITFGPEATYGNDDVNGFGYPPFGGNFGSTHQYLAGTLIFTEVKACSDPATDASLSSLALNRGTLSPAFVAVTTGYTAAVDKAFSSVTITVASTDPKAMIKINGISTQGSASATINFTLDGTSVPIEVTAQDGVTKKTYTVNVVVTGCESAAAQSYVSNTQTGVQAFRGELGMEFIVNNASGISIKQLGAFDDGGDGINGTQNGGVRVAIFNRATHALVPGLDATVTGLADAYTGNHRMKNITPVTLPPGDYMLVAKGYGSAERNGNATAGGGLYPNGNDGNGAITFGPETTYGSDNPNGFVYPPDGGNFGNSHIFLAGTFNYTVNIACSTGGSGARMASVTTTDSIVSPAALTGNKIQGLKIYPNPASGRFNLQLTDVNASKINVQIMNASGLAVAQKTVSVAAKTPLLLVSFNLVNLPAGVYFVKIQSSDGVRTEKIIIQR